MERGFGALSHGNEVLSNLFENARGRVKNCSALEEGIEVDGLAAISAVEKSQHFQTASPNYHVYPSKKDQRHD